MEQVLTTMLKDPPYCCAWKMLLRLVSLYIFGCFGDKFISLLHALFEDQIGIDIRRMVEGH